MSLFPADVVCLEVSPIPEAPPIHPNEAALVAGAVEGRKGEFATGRWLAARAMRRLGVPSAPLLSGPHREPLWPSSVVGSISHTNEYCVVVAAQANRYRSLGVDAEPFEPLEAELWPSICTPGELAWLRTRPSSDRGTLCRIIFSAKECFYKWQFPLTGAFLEFEDVEIRLDVEAGAFSVISAAAIRSRLGATPQGAFIVGDGRLLTGLSA